MARRINPLFTKGEQSTDGEKEEGLLEGVEGGEGAEDAAEKGPVAGLPGGSLGVPHATGSAPGVMPALAPTRVAEKITQYRVVNGGSIMYGGCRTALRPGKIVDAYSYDLDLLRKQGIQLEEVK